MRLQCKNLTQSYGDTTVLRGVDFTIDDGEIACLLGPSGCGKTTILRCIAGFETLVSGSIALGDEILSTPDLTVPPQSRGVGMVFQDYALLPHLSVAENVRFGLHGLDRDARQERVSSILEITGLTDDAGLYPHQLSGGQQQRVALARSLAPKPRLLLMDEPFSSLDRDLRHRLSIEVRAILKRIGTMALMVTHDQQEAFAIADRIGVMYNGAIQQWDTPYNLYHRPESHFVASFVGQGAFVPGQVLEPNAVNIELGVLHGEMLRPMERGSRVSVLLRPDDIVHDDESALTAEVCRKAFRGADILYTLKLESGAEVLSLVPSHHDHRIGEHIGIRLCADHIVAFSR